MCGMTANGLPTTVHRLRIDLMDARPPIWRRLEVPSETSLRALHMMLQTAFGWQNRHLYRFSEAQSGREFIETARLADVLPGKGDRIHYLYDFGDDWLHVITVQDIIARDPAKEYPVCTGGRNAGPPEDCGGVWGYEDLLEVLADPGHPDHAARLEWLDLSSADEFEPTSFDRSIVNHDLLQLK
jgi:Plasmid pRiA4b ORF-3-like protein